MSQVKLQYSIVQIVVTEIITRILAENSCLCTEKASLNAIAVAFVITQP